MFSLVNENIILSGYLSKYHKILVLFNKPGKRSNEYNYESEDREKRSISDKIQSVADDPQSPEHLKLLEQSFPNPASINTFHQSDFNLLRVKRDDQ